MGNTITTNGVTTTSTDKDTEGNVKFNTGAVVLPYVTQGQWSTPGNYSFLDTRYDSKYAPISGGGYLDKTSFDGVLSASAPYNTLKTGLDGLGTKYNNMQNTYNSNFSTIASNLGLTTSGGVVSGTVNSSTFVTQSNLNDMLSKKFKFLDAGRVLFQGFGGNSNNSIVVDKLRVYKSGNQITYTGFCSVYPDLVLCTIDLTKFASLTADLLSQVELTVTVQVMDSCGSSLFISQDPNTMMCSMSNTPFYTRVVANDPSNKFIIGRKNNLAGNGNNIVNIQFIAIGYNNM